MTSLHHHSHREKNVLLPQQQQEHEQELYYAGKRWKQKSADAPMKESTSNNTSTKRTIARQQHSPSGSDALSSMIVLGQGSYSVSWSQLLVRTLYPTRFLARQALVDFKTKNEQQQQQQSKQQHKMEEDDQLSYTQRAMLSSFRKDIAPIDDTTITTKATTAKAHHESPTKPTTSPASSSSSNQQKHPRLPPFLHKQQRKNVDTSNTTSVTVLGLHSSSFFTSPSLYLTPIAAILILGLWRKKWRHQRAKKFPTSNSSESVVRAVSLTSSSSLTDNAHQDWQGLLTMKSAAVNVPHYSTPLLKRRPSKSSLMSLPEQEEDDSSSNYQTDHEPSEQSSIFVPPASVPTSMTMPAGNYLHDSDISETSHRSLWSDSDDDDDDSSSETSSENSWKVAGPNTARALSLLSSSFESCQEEQDDDNDHSMSLLDTSMTTVATNTSLDWTDHHQQQHRRRRSSAMTLATNTSLEALGQDHHLLKTNSISSLIGQLLFETGSGRDRQDDSSTSSSSEYSELGDSDSDSDSDSDMSDDDDESDDNSSFGFYDACEDERALVMCTAHLSPIRAPKKKSKRHATDLAVVPASPRRGKRDKTNTSSSNNLASSLPLTRPTDRLPLLPSSSHSPNFKQRRVSFSEPIDDSEQPLWEEEDDDDDFFGNGSVEGSLALTTTSATSSSITNKREKSRALLLSGKLPLEPTNNNNESSTTIATVDDYDANDEEEPSTFLSSLRALAYRMIGAGEPSELDASLSSSFEEIEDTQEETDYLSLPSFSGSTSSHGGSDRNIRVSPSKLLKRSDQGSRSNSANNSTTAKSASNKLNGLLKTNTKYSGDSRRKSDSEITQGSRDMLKKLGKSMDRLCVDKEHRKKLQNARLVVRLVLGSHRKDYKTSKAVFEALDVVSEFRKQIQHAVQEMAKGQQVLDDFKAVWMKICQVKVSTSLSFPTLPDQENMDQYDRIMNLAQEVFQFFHPDAAFDIKENEYIDLSNLPSLSGKDDMTLFLGSAGGLPVSLPLCSIDADASKRTRETPYKHDKHYPLSLQDALRVVRAIHGPYLKRISRNDCLRAIQVYGLLKIQYKRLTEQLTAQRSLVQDLTQNLERLCLMFKLASKPEADTADTQATIVLQLEHICTIIGGSGSDKKEA